MENVKEIRTGRHCVFMMHVHLVFVTKYRRGVFTKEILDDLKPIFASVCTDFGAELVEFDGEDDHVHLLVNYPPKLAVSSLVNSLKGVSSRLIRKRGYPGCGAVLSGHQATLPVVVVALRFQSSDSTSKISVRRTEKARFQSRCYSASAARMCGRAKSKITPS